MLFSAAPLTFFVQVVHSNTSIKGGATVVQLVTAYNFISVKKSIPRILENLSDIRISNINKTLRKIFVGKEVDSLLCRKLRRNLISVKITLKGAVIVFQVDINRRGGRR